MLTIFPQAEPRPNSLVPEQEKEMDYHRKWGRFCVSSGYNWLQAQFIDKCALNRRFYRNDQWVLEEDIESFLKDDEDNDRNRLQLTKNVIRPMVEQYRGNSIRMNINFRAQAISSKAVNRREMKLAEMQFYTDMANESSYGDVLRAKLPIGQDNQQTEQFFGELYEDNYEQAINWLIEYVEHYNQFDQKQPLIAMDMALNGIGVIKDFEYAGHQVFEQIKSENFFFDRTCINQDLSDSQYMGEVIWLTPEDIFEQYPDIDDNLRTALVNFAQAWSSYLQNGQLTQDRFYAIQGRIPVYTSYWKDTQKYEMAYVKEKKFGYPYFTKINFTYPGEDKPRYTDADIIEMKGERAEKILKGKKKRSMYLETLRYCVLIPQEVFGYADETKMNGIDPKKIGDIVLDYGLAPYQETECYDWNHVKFPYKCYCWSYVDGQIQAPIDDAIDPQRFINRLFSIAENQINNSRGSGTVIDTSVVDPDGGQSEILRNMNLSKPVFVDGRGRGIQNVVSSYDTTVKQGTMVLFNLIDVAGKFIQDTTGVNDALKGESTGSDQLVGVTQLMIQRGSLMQEPFYYAMVNIFQQCYQSIASRGKRIYAESGRELPIIVGDSYAKMFRITKDMKIEDFRIFVTRQNSDEALISAGNQMLTVFLQMGLINQDQFAELFDRSSPSEISAAIRRFAAQKRVMATLQQQRDQQAAQQMQGQMQQEQANAQAQQEQQIQGALAANEAQQQQNNKFKIQQQYAKSLGDMAKAGQINPEQFKVDMQKMT